MKNISNAFAKLVGKNIKREMDSACIMFGYQPVVPDSAKKFRDRKKKSGRTI